MTEQAIVLNISQMIDLAIGTPEVGTVDFNMLQTVLHCLAQQLRVLDKNVEVRSGVMSLPIPTAKENFQTIAVTEFIVDPDKIKQAEATPATEPDNTILVVERIKKTESPVQTITPFAAPAQAPSKPRPSQVTSAEARTSEAQPPSMPQTDRPSIGPIAISSSEKLSLVTISKFNILENAVEDLKNRVYGSMPKNEEILEEVRSQTNLKAITDMWTSLNVSSRLEAAETGIGKLSSLVQDLISETAELQGKRRPTSLIEETPQTDVAEAPPTPEGCPPPSKEELEKIQNNLIRLRADLDQLTQTFYTTMEEMQTGLDLPPRPPQPPDSLPTAGAVSEILPTQDQQGQKAAQASLIADLVERINDIDKRLKECCEKIGKNDGVVSDQLNSFQDQLELVLKQVASLSEELTSGKLSPDLVKDLQGLMQLFQTVQEMQDQLQKVHDTALHLAAEKEDRQYHMNALLEQIELLKNIKLDREDMVEAMAEKADLRMLARKVSHDQFEIACDDLSKGVEHALGKLNMQEALWQQALDDIQREIESKLDKIELSPVKDFFNSKLKQLQTNLKQMASLRREVEAAGTKKKLLRDVNCISCDANAVMPMEAASTVPVAKPMPATLSMKPYLSYELDAIRKTQASNLPQRNMHDWENIDKQMSQPKPPQKVRSDTDKHICNRYCGGSHTVTTAAQRVARLGHFIKQWGPDVVPLSSGLATGDDGRMYRVSPAEDAKVGPGGAVDATCTPKPPPRKSEAKPVQKPIIISAECRCLEAAETKK